MLEGRRGFSAFNVAEAESFGKCPYQSREDSESQAAMLEGRRGFLAFKVAEPLSRGNCPYQSREKILNIRLAVSVELVRKV